jgi:AraC family transcriptional regulator
LNQDLDTLQMQPGQFFGDTVSKRIAGAILSEVTHPGSRCLPTHAHQWPYLCMLLQGFYNETVGTKPISYDPFTAVFHGASLVHDDAIGEDGARFFIVELDEEWQSTIERYGGAPQYAYELHGDGASWVALRLYHDFVAGTASDETVEESLLELCAYLPASPPGDAFKPSWFDAVVERLVEDFRKPYSLRQLAHEVGIDPSHLARTFYRFRGRTIGDFVMRLRVQDACRHIRKLDRTLSAIARSSGFSDQSHMTRSIRRIAGNTPAELRRILQ